MLRPEGRERRTVLRRPGPADGAGEESCPGPGTVSGPLAEDDEDPTAGPDEGLQPRRVRGVRTVQNHHVVLRERDTGEPVRGHGGHLVVGAHREGAAQVRGPAGPGLHDQHPGRAALVEDEVERVVAGEGVAARPDRAPDRPVRERHRVELYRGRAARGHDGGPGGQRPAVDDELDGDLHTVSNARPADGTGP